MGFWDEFRDSIEAPFKAIGDLVSGIASGGNVLSNTEQFIGRNVFSVDPISQGAIQNNSVVNGLLSNDTVGKLTLGLSGDALKISNYNQAADVNNEANVSLGDAAHGFTDAYLKVGAAAVGASEGVAATGGVSGATSSAEVTAATYGGVTTEQKAASLLSTGNVSSDAAAVTNVTNLTGITDTSGFASDVSGAVSAAGDAASAASQAQDAASQAAGSAGTASSIASTVGQSVTGASNLLDLVKSNTPPVTKGNLTTVGGGVSSTSGVAVPAMGILAYLLLKGKS